MVVADGAGMGGDADAPLPARQDKGFPRASGTVHGEGVKDGAVVRIPADSYYDANRFGYGGLNMIVDGFRSSLRAYCVTIEDGVVDTLLLASMDRKLCDVANHLAFCHRNYVEKRVEANSLLALMTLRRKRLAHEAAQADRMVEETLEIQDQLIALRTSVLVRLFDRIYEQMPSCLL
jgi:hypothetical protein